MVVVPGLKIPRAGLYIMQKKSKYILYYTTCKHRSMSVSMQTDSIKHLQINRVVSVSAS